MHCMLENFIGTSYLLSFTIYIYIKFNAYESDKNILFRISFLYLAFISFLKVDSIK